MERLAEAAATVTGSSASDSGKMCWKPGVLCAGNSEQQGRWG